MSEYRILTQRLGGGRYITSVFSDGGLVPSSKEFRRDVEFVSGRSIDLLEGTDSDVHQIVISDSELNEERLVDKWLDSELNIERLDNIGLQ